MLIIKVGGGADINIPGIVNDLAALNDPFVVILGANALRDSIGERLAMTKQELTSLSGYTSVYSDESAIDLIMMTYAGLRNRRFVELCQRQGVNAIGLSGLDGRLVQGERNRGIRVREGGKTILKRDFSGKPRSANTTLLELLLKHEYRPVISIPIIDEQGHAINSENDDIVNVLQKGLNATRILQLIEAPGFLDNRSDPTSVVPQMSQAELAQREQQVEGRMKRKMLALRTLFTAGTAEVVIADGRVEHPVQDALAGRGTIIR